MTFVQAACFPVALQTMHNAIVTAGRLKGGESLLIQGASTGVGLLGMQIGKVMGAALVIGTSTNPERRARLTEFGCDLALDSTDSKWPDAVKQATGQKGVDLIVDQVSASVANQNLAAAAILGRIVNVGRLGGQKGEFDFDLHALKRIDYIGVTFRTRSLEEVRAINRAMRADLWGTVEAGKPPARPQPRALRSRLWFDNPDNPRMTALYLERYLNFGLTGAELRSGKPIIGIAQTGSDLSPCNRHHLDLAHRVREGIRSAGGVALEFPTHPIQETGKRPTAALDRNLAYLGLVEILFGYPLDGVVLTTGCDKTTPACLMAAATVNLPAIVLSGGPMLNGWHNGERTGSGTVVWKARERMAAGEIDYEEFMNIVASSAPSVGHCNTMGTASTMNSLAEALGMSLPGCAAIPAPYRERRQIAYDTGVRAVEIVHEDLRPSDILTRKAFENTIVANSAIGGSTNAPIHINAIARHIGVKLSIQDWEKVGYDVPLLVNMQPDGFYLGEEYFRAGGLPAVMNELLKAKRIHADALTINGKTMGENVKRAKVADADVIKPYNKPMKKQAGFKVLTGNLFDS